MAGWTHLAGKERRDVHEKSRIHQKISTRPGHRYLISARFHTSVENGPRGDTRVRFCADPSGGRDFRDAHKSQWYFTDSRWLRFQHRFTAAGEEATVGIEFYRWRDLDRASAHADQVLVLDLGPLARASGDPPPDPRFPPALALTGPRVESGEGVEVRLEAPPGFVMTGMGARAAAGHLTTLMLRVAPLLPDGTLGEPEEMRAGREPDADLEAEIRLPPGHVATGFGARITPGGDVKTLALWGRPLLPGGLLGGERELRAGVEPGGGLERRVRLEAAAESPARVLISAGLRCPSNDAGGISARSALLEPTATEAERRRESREKEGENR